MQSFGAFLSDNKGWAALAALLVVVIVIAGLLILYRIVFGRRLHMMGGRSRQPRLGVVDAFDLDRQRQLVLIRRDNVEHLVMIGGPNDIVIESAFIRAQPSVAVPVGRDKEVSAPAAPLIPMPAPLQPGHGDPRPSAQATATDGPPAPAPASPPIDLTQPVSPKDLGPLSDLPAPAPVKELAPEAAPEPQPVPVPATAAENIPPSPEPPQPPHAAAPASAAIPPLPATPPTPRPPFSRLAQGLPPRPAGSMLPPRPPLSSLRTPVPGPGQAATPPRPTGNALPNRPTPLVPLQRGTSAASLRRDAPAPADPPVDSVEEARSPEGAASSRTAVPALPQTLPSPPGPSITLDSIESLEEEMAKLLGRAAGSDKK